MTDTEREILSLQGEVLALKSMLGLAIVSLSRNAGGTAVLREIADLFERMKPSPERLMLWIQIADPVRA